jgi:hypothetical protein
MKAPSVAHSSRMVTVPAITINADHVPALDPFCVISPTPSTAGMPYSRATMEPCARMLPISVTSAVARATIGWADRKATQLRFVGSVVTNRSHETIIVMYVLVGHPASLASNGIALASEPVARDYLLRLAYAGLTGSSDPIALAKRNRVLSSRTGASFGYAFDRRTRPPRLPVCSSLRTMTWPLTRVARYPAAGWVNRLLPNGKS